MPTGPDPARRRDGTNRARRNVALSKQRPRALTDIAHRASAPRVSPGTWLSTGSAPHPASLRHMGDCGSSRLYAAVVLVVDDRHGRELGGELAVARPSMCNPRSGLPEVATPSSFAKTVARARREKGGVRMTLCPVWLCPVRPAVLARSASGDPGRTCQRWHVAHTLVPVQLLWVSGSFSAAASVLYRRCESAACQVVFDGGSTSSASSSRTRRSISSTIGRTTVMSFPEGSSSSHSR